MSKCLYGIWVQLTQSCVSGILFGPESTGRRERKAMMIVNEEDAGDHANELEVKEVCSSLRASKGLKEGAHLNTPSRKSVPSLPRRVTRNASNQRRVPPRSRSADSIDNVLLSTGSSSKLQSLLSTNPSSRPGKDVGTRSCCGPANEATTGSHQRTKPKTERDKTKDKTRDRIRRERKQKEESKPSLDNQEEPPSQCGNKPCEKSSQTARSMLREPSQRGHTALTGELNGRNEPSSCEVKRSRSEIMTRNLWGNIDYMRSEDDKDDGVGVGADAVLQFDPTSTGNLFSVKQFHNVESECIIYSPNGSESIVRKWGMADPVSQEVQQQRSASLPIFDILEDDRISLQSSVLPPSQHGISPALSSVLPPSQHDKLPSQRCKSPSQRCKSPSQRYTSPSRRSKSPSPRSKSHSPHSKSPSQRSKSPIHHCKSPNGQENRRSLKKSSRDNVQVGNAAGCFENTPSPPNRKKLLPYPDTSSPRPGSKKATECLSSPGRRKGKKTLTKSQPSSDDETNNETSDSTAAVDRPKRKSKKPTSQKSRDSSVRRKSLNAKNEDDEDDILEFSISKPSSSNLLNAQSKSCKTPESKQVSSSARDSGLRKKSSSSIAEERKGATTAPSAKSTCQETVATTEPPTASTCQETAATTAPSTKSTCLAPPTPSQDKETVASTTTSGDERDEPSGTAGFESTGASGKKTRRRSLDLASSIGRYFSKTRTNSADFECSSRDDGSLQSSSSRSRFSMRSAHKSHQLLDNGSNSDLDASFCNDT